MNTSIPADEYARQTKKLTATVNRLRSRIATDESKTAEFGDALVALTEHRLRGHCFAEAALEAQEALSVAAKLVAGHGPLGPYTPAEDATRLVRAAVHLAVVQTEAGQAEAAAQVLATAEGLIRTLSAHGLRLHAGPETNVWALVALSRVALADGDAARANATIGAAPAGVDFQELDRLSALADARWAAGRATDSIAAAWRAVERHDEMTAGLLASAKRLAPARLARIAQPLSGLRAHLADRLAASGDIEAGLSVRRDLVSALEALDGLLGATGAAELAAARRALADDLLRTGRSAEAETLLALPGVRAVSPRQPIEAVTEQLSWQPLSPDEPFADSQVGAGAGLEDAAARAEEVRAEASSAERERARQAAESAQRQAEQDARAAAERAERERVAAEERERLAAEQRARAEAERAAAERAAIAESQRQRAERLAAHEQAQREREAELRAEAERADDAVEAARARLAACRAAGDRAAAYGAALEVVAELRSRFTADPAVAGELVAALQELATAQRQAGDWWGSRKPAKEAKELSRRWLR
ncbi:MAG: hypothetical protein Q3997_07720 [Propionibacteriaceae bacterium]|nr:hypothetical protein [Propionibacteriaceae bacterium]